MTWTETFKRNRRRIATAGGKARQRRDSDPWFWRVSRASARLFGSRTNERMESLKDILESQGYRCALTGTTLTPDTAEVDHIKPRARGGTSRVGNLQWVTRQVNQIKRDMDNGEFIALCCSVADHARKP